MAHHIFPLVTQIDHALFTSDQNGIANSNISGPGSILVRQQQNLIEFYTIW